MAYSNLLVPKTNEDKITIVPSVHRILFPTLSFKYLFINWLSMSVPPPVYPALKIIPAPNPYRTPPKTADNNNCELSISMYVPISEVSFTHIGKNNEPRIEPLVFSLPKNI